MPIIPTILSDDLPPPSNDDPKWRIYEKAIADFKESFGDCTVIRDHKVTGRRSGVERQIDVWLEAVIGGSHKVCVAVECKCYDTTKIDIKDIDAFCGFLDDVGASKGVFITSSGFTSGAEKRAEGAQIDLQIITLEEAAVFDWAELVTTSCQAHRPCWGTVDWHYEDDGSSAGFCGHCGQFHIECGNCGEVSDYEEGGGQGSYSSEIIECMGCEQKWAISYDKGVMDGFESLALKKPTETEN
jgi:hypothetical protein